jgi:hypothetical protein
MLHAEIIPQNSLDFLPTNINNSPLLAGGVHTAGGGPFEAAPT